jgi:hypothetical protein
MTSAALWRNELLRKLGDRWRLAAMPIVVCALALGCGSADENAQPPSRSPSTALDGIEKSLVVVGYSTSYVWPEMLQEMLDDHAGGERLYHVLNAVVGGSPVSRWIGDPTPEDRDDTFGAMMHDFFGPQARLRGAAPEPSTALCQQSLQFTRTLRGPVPDADDPTGIEIGTEALETLATGLHEQGIERVYIAMHIYKEPVEPEVGNERLALAALLERNHEFVLEGPDVWAPTRDAYPEAFEEDGVHPNELGMKIMAEGWYRTLAGDEARQEVVDRLYRRSYDIETIMTEFINWRRRE